jgi:ornithine--oxo-acid transaminase
MTDSRYFIDLEQQFGAFNYKPLDVVLHRGQGIWVWDVDGHRYLDCLSAYSAVNQGHCHPKILKTLIEQAQTLCLTSRAFRNDQLGPFYQEVCELTRSQRVLPMNSGAEAVEAVIKKDTHAHTIRFSPPLVIQRPDIEWALERIREVFAAAGP